jgi:hypothetical protein
MNVAHEQIAITCNYATIKPLKIVSKQYFRQITRVLHTLGNALAFLPFYGPKQSHSFYSSNAKLWIAQATRLSFFAIGLIHSFSEQVQA